MAAATLECTLSAPSRVRAGEPVPLDFRLVNRSSQAVLVLRWRTPLEGLLGNDLRITRDDTELPYTGPMMKRGDPAAEDYVALAPGASAEARVDLAQAYAMQEPGRYRITLRGPVMDVATDPRQVPRPLAELHPMPLACPGVEVEVVAPR